MVSINELTIQDVEFLQAVREINKNPDEYQDTDITSPPANTKSIRKATDLNSKQVSYRMCGNSNSRGFDEIENPIVITHSPEMLESGTGPRSIELTEYGVEMLSKAQNKMNRISGISRKEFDELSEQVEKLTDGFKQWSGRALKNQGRLDNLDDLIFILMDQEEASQKGYDINDSTTADTLRYQLQQNL